MAATNAQVTFAFLAKDAASKSIRAIGSNLKGLKDVAGTVAKGVAIAFAAVAAAATAAAYKTAQFAKEAIQGAIEDAAAQSKLVAVLNARNLATEKNLATVDKLIVAGQNLAFTDDEIRAGIATATQFTNKFTKAQKILTVAQDLARAKSIPLEKATLLVGRAYKGSTGALSRYGVLLEKGTKGVKALDAVTKKFGGAAKANAETAAGQFEIFNIKIAEAKEAIGGALLPAVLKIFKAIQPIADELLASLESKLPDLEKFATSIADNLIAKLPRLISTAKREIPIVLGKIKDFAFEFVTKAKEIAQFLGPDGVVTTGLVAIGGKLGGLGGAIGGALTKAFSDLGFGPLESAIAGSVSGAIIGGIVQGLASSLVTNAIAAFGAKLKGATTVATSGGVRLPTAVGPATAAGGAGSAILGVSTAAIASVASVAMATAAVVGAAALLYSTLVPKEVQAAISQRVGAGARDRAAQAGGAFGAGGVYGGNSMNPTSSYLNLQNTTTLKVDGAVLARTVDKYLGVYYRAAGTTRTGGR
jgi:hypothetical protein